VGESDEVVLGGDVLGDELWAFVCGVLSFVVSMEDVVDRKIIRTPVSILIPFTCLAGSCTLGLCWIKDPSVTGRNAQVPYLPDEDTLTFAACSNVVLVF
jgi:hypothetical protein